MNSIRKHAIRGVKWTTISTFMRVGIQVLQLLILARFLSAEDFGLVAIVMLVIRFSELFMDMGISNALIHEQNISKVQLSSLYWLNLFSGFVLFMIVYLLAPIIESFYREPQLVFLLRILSFTFIINSIGNQYRVLWKKEMRFKSIGLIEIMSSFLSFIVAIVLAVLDYGALSLVVAFLVNVTIINVCFLFVGLKYHRPKFIYKHAEVVKFISFGLYQMGQKIIVYFNNQFDIILIGKFLGAEILGGYSLTKQLVMRPTLVINPVITNVSFPVMAKAQSDTVKLNKIYLRIVNYLSAINFPIYLLMFVLAEPLITLLLGEKWEGFVNLFRILSLYALFRSTTNPAGSLVLSKGRADLGFWWSLLEFSILPLIIYVGSHYGIEGIAFGLLIFQFSILFPNWLFIVRRICGASFYDYLMVQLKPLISIILSVLFTHFIIGSIEMNSIFKIVTYSILTVTTYLGLSVYFNQDFLNEMRLLLLKNKK